MPGMILRSVFIVLVSLILAKFIWLGFTVHEADNVMSSAQVKLAMNYAKLIRQSLEALWGTYNLEGKKGETYQTRDYDVFREKVEEIWEAAKGALQVQVNKANYETWLKDTKGLSYQGNRFVVGTPSAFASEWLGKRLQSMVEKTLISIIGHQVEVTFQVCPRGEAYSHITAPPGPFSEKSSFSIKLNPKYTFDGFVVGRCNRFA